MFILYFCLAIFIISYIYVEISKTPIAHAFFLFLLMIDIELFVVQVGLSHKVKVLEFIQFHEEFL